MPHDPAEEMHADLLALALAGRADRVVDAVLATLPPEARGAFVATAEALTAVGLAADEIAPSRGLRARVLASVVAKRRAPRRALLVVDMINDYVRAGGPMEVPRARAIVPALATRIESARAEGVPVVYIVDRHSHDDADLDVWGTHAVEGSTGGEVWPELAPRADDRIVAHPTYSGFFKSDLDTALRALNVDTLVITGCLTEIQMFATATDAMQRGYAVEVPADAQAGASESGEQVAMAMMRFMAPYEPARRALLASLPAIAPAV